MNRYTDLALALAALAADPELGRAERRRMLDCAAAFYWMAALTSGPSEVEACAFPWAALGGRERLRAAVVSEMSGRPDVINRGVSADADGTAELFEAGLSLWVSRDYWTSQLGLAYLVLGLLSDLYYGETRYDSGRRSLIDSALDENGYGDGRLRRVAGRIAEALFDRLYVRAA